MTVSLIQSLWRLISTLMIVLPLMVLGVHFGLDQKQIKNCQDKGGSFQVTLKACDYHNTHTVKPYKEREWRRIVLTEILVIIGFFMKLILSHHLRSKRNQKNNVKYRMR